MAREAGIPDRSREISRRRLSSATGKNPQAAQAGRGAVVERWNDPCFPSGSAGSGLRSRNPLAAGRADRILAERLARFRVAAAKSASPAVANGQAATVLVLFFLFRRHAIKPISFFQITPAV